MSKIYNYLKNKVNNPNYKNLTYYIQQDIMDGNCVYPYKEYTFNDLYERINIYINYYQKNYHFNNNICFLIINTSFNDIAAFIALMEIGVKPIIVNSAILENLYFKNIINKEDLPYEIISSEIIDNYINYGIKSSEVIKTITYNNKNKMRTGFDKKEVERILYGSIELDNLNDSDDFDFAILTSGTTGKSKIQRIKEKDLINKIRNKYDLDKEETFVSQNPISAISGLTFSMYLPIIGNNKKTHVGNIFFEQDHLSNHLNIIIPGNYLFNEYMINYNMPFLVEGDKPTLTSKIDQITLLGDKTRSVVIQLLHNVLTRLPIGKIINYYGRTENLGLVSQINEKDMKEVYLYYPDIRPNKIVYSYDKINVYEKTMINGTTIIKKSDIPFNQDLFCDVMPIANINTKDEDIKIDQGIFGEIIAENNKTNDYGFILDNKIYYLCRKDELIEMNDERHYYISGLEEGLFRMLVSIPEHTNQSCICVKNSNNNINLYIPCQLNKYRCDNYRLYRAALNHFFSKLSDFDIKIDEINLVDKKNIPHGYEIGKLKRNELLKMSSMISPTDLNNFNDYKELLIKIIKIIHEKEFNIDFIFDYVVLSKKEFEPSEISDIISFFNILDYRQDDEKYYLVISDDFLFSKKKIKEECDTEEYAKDFILTDKLRALCRLNDCTEDITVKIGLFYNEDNRLTAVIDAEEFNAHGLNQVNLCNYRMKNKDEMKIIEYRITINKYEMNYDRYYFCHEYSIDENNNIYRDNKPVKIDPLTLTITQSMYDFLIKNKDILEKKSYKKIK